MPLARMVPWLAAALAACDPAGLELVVQLRTDLVPGIELTGVEVELGGRTLAHLPAAGDDYASGVRVAAFAGLGPGTHEVTVTLVRGLERIVERPLVANLRASTALTVIVTRDCRGVSCPDAGGDPSLSACLAGACVDPSCTPETPESCPSAACAADSDCPAPGAACAAPRCVEGVCFHADLGACPATEFCDPDQGCRPRPDGAPADGGVDGGPSCRDLDGDGSLSCDQDCDDLDPFTNSGAYEVCGDLRSNDCRTAPDERCMGLGTFVAPPPLGDDANPGTQAAPVATMARAIANAVAIGGLIDVFLAEGEYVEDVSLPTGVGLRGGFHASWRRGETSRSTLRPPGPEGLRIGPGSSGRTHIDGLSIYGRSGPGDTAAITIAADTGAILDGSTVIGGDSMGGDSYAVRIEPGGRGQGPSLQALEIRTGQTDQPSGTSYGVWAEDAAVRIDFVQLRLGAGSGTQVGLRLSRMFGALVQPMTIVGTGTPRVVTGIVASGTVWLSNVRVDPGGATESSVGVRVEGGGGVQLVTSVILGGRGTSSSTAILVDPPDPEALDLLVHSSILGGGDGASSAGVRFGPRGTPSTAGRFYNSFVVAGSGASRHAIVENDANLRFERLHHCSLYVASGGAPTASGPFLAGATELDLAAVNALPGALANLDADCGADVSVLGGAACAMGSVCVDAGTLTELPDRDFNGGPRIQGSGPDLCPIER